MLNSRDIDRLRPDVAANCRAWLELCRAAGLLVLVTGTVRDEEDQQEVGQEVLSLVGHAEGDGIISASCAALFLPDDVQVGIDVAGIFLFGEWHGPEVGTGCVRSFLCAHLADHLFPQHEGHHAAEVGFLQWR